jgi:hypothetical protein
VQREQPVIGVVAEEFPVREHQFEPHGADREAADEEEERDRQRVENPDALVVGGGDPRPQCVAMLKIAFFLVPMANVDEGGVAHGRVSALSDFR